MKPFAYLRAATVDEAVAEGARPGAKFLGGGTNLVDLMRGGIEQPSTVVDLTRLPLEGIEELPDGGLRVGALAKAARTAAHPLVRERYPLVADALLAGASPQLRNMATIGGNLMQRTRCPYFYDLAARCNKRAPGAGCDAIGGPGRTAALLGGGAGCVAVHPSDLCVALVAQEAVVVATGPGGTRRVRIGDFHLPPGDTPHVETGLAADELITSVELPPPHPGRAAFRKVRDRASYAFALVSVAASLAVRDGVVADARLALGGVATTPWRARAAERALLGARAEEAAFDAAAHAELAAAERDPRHAARVALTRRTLVAVLRSLA